MAEKKFTAKCADGKTYEFTRTEKQGRPSRGMEKWNGYISREDLDALRSAAIPPYITVSSMIQDAINGYVRTKLVNT